MTSKRRVIVGWRQVPVQKVRTRTGRPAAAPAVAPLAPAAIDPADESDEIPPPDLPGRSK